MTLSLSHDRASTLGNTKYKLILTITFLCQLKDSELGHIFWWVRIGGSGTIPKTTVMLMPREFDIMETVLKLAAGQVLRCFSFYVHVKQLGKRVNH